MMPSKKRRKPKKQKDLEDLCLLISQLDGIRGFRRVDPEAIKEAFKRAPFKDVGQEWKKIRHDVEKIVYLPLTIHGIPTLIRLAVILKLLIPISLIFIVLTIAPKMFSFQLIPLPPIFGEETLIFFGILSVIVMNGFVMTDFIIRRRITKYEEKHKEKFSKGKERIKDVTQTLILKLVEKLKRRGGDPDDYKMIFFFKDYMGIKVVKESRGRIFKKKYPVYTVIPLIE